MYKKRINLLNYSQYLKHLLKSKKEDAEEDNTPYKFENPFERTDEREFIDLALRERVEILHQLCELRLESIDVSEKVKNLDAASLRIEPLGRDSEGSTLWYFYGTRLYKEELPVRNINETLLEREERKRKKKHKKEKKKKRKKSREYCTESSDDEQEAIWSVVCLTEEDWENLTLKYKESRQREDRRLYRLLGESFLPEIKEMFVEKEKEEKRKMQLEVSKRSATRRQVLRKTQEEKDRQLAMTLAEENGDVKGKRGRKRKNDDLEEGVPVERDERAKQRQMMKEMRSKKAAEKLVESKFSEDVTHQKAVVNKIESAPSKEKATNLDPEKETSVKSEHEEDIKTNKEKAEDCCPSSDETPPSSRESSPSSPSSLSDMDSDDVYRPPRSTNGPKNPRSNMFTNALIKAGSKSTKDSTLDKEREREKNKTIKDILLEKPTVRKTPGLLLQTAGKGLLNTKRNEENQKSDNEDSPKIKPSSGISFGLWGGHLSIDKNSVTNRVNTGSDDRTYSLDKDNKEEGTKKAFSNWGGDFFKKNLDLRANTNKILEKMQLQKAVTTEPNEAAFRTG